MANESFTVGGEKARQLILAGSGAYALLHTAMNKENVKARAQEFLTQRPVKQVL